MLENFAKLIKLNELFVGGRNKKAAQSPSALELLAARLSVNRLFCGNPKKKVAELLLEMMAVKVPPAKEA